ncbi:HAD-IA family hydrolase [Halapricum sp. CBA1109]|uniref:HAD family hydrolase n=1 Tax=Halapricum sp. CBA1109 TaxID=2668068 RepID=UPI0013BD3653|nr:HAD-IA family hydrolase [Halapricum sp. CBA1109]
MNYDAVVFDNDGVIVDLTGDDTHRAGARDAFEAVGVTDPDPADVEAMSIGVTVPKLTAVCDRYDLDVERFWRARDRALSERQRDLMRAGRKRPYDDVDHLDRLSRPLGVVSSNQQATVEFAYDHFGLADHFETVRARPPTVESLRRKKPDPHYVEAALSELGVESALYVGDSEHDVEAAHAAGVDAAFLRRPHTRGRTLSVDPEHDLSGLDEVAALFD